MAGTVTVDTIKSGVASTPTVFRDTNNVEIGQLCKAWLNYNISGSATRSSFNVSSVTKSSTGVFTFSLTTALSDSNGCVSGAGSSNTTSTLRGMMTVESNLPTSSSFPMYCLNDNGTASDGTFCGIKIHR